MKHPFLVTMIGALLLGGITGIVMGAVLFFLHRRKRERAERERAERLAHHNILFIDRSHKSRLIREYGIRTPEGLHRR